MGSCTRRHFLLSTCFLQMITIIERQVFDFLGYMWAPIFVNFFHILFIIFGFYGAYHFRIKYIITYLIWNFLWIGWNSFLICFYLNVGTLDRDSDLLNLGTGSVSWFEVNGYGCKPIYNTNITIEDPYRPIRPEFVDGCLLTYDIVEVVHSGVQCILAFFGILGAILISYIFLDEDDRFDFMNGDAKSPQHTVVHPMYVSYTSIPTSASATMLSNKHQNQNHTPHSFSNSNNHLSNSNHAIFTNTTTSITTPTATKKIFSSSQQTSLHKQILTSATNTNLNKNTTNNQQSNSISHSHSNSNKNSNNNNNCNNSNNNSHANSNTFLIHTHRNNHQQQQYSNSQNRREGSYNGSLVSNSSQFETFNTGSSHHHRRRYRNMSPTSHSYTPNPSNGSNSLSHMLYSPKQSRKVQPTSSNSIFPANIDLAQKQPIIPAYYDDSTAKADHQLYVNGSRRQMLLTHSPTQDTTPSLSYASLQNSTHNLNSSFKQNATPSLGSVANPLSSSLSNSNYSLTNSLNNNQSQQGIKSVTGEGHFARIHSKPKPAKSSSYSSFKHVSIAANNVVGATAGQRPDVKYSQVFNETKSNQFDESFEEDNILIQNLKTNEGMTYVPFTKPTPGNYYLIPSSQHGENNNSPNSLNSPLSQGSLNNNSNHHQSLRTSPNNNSSQIAVQNYHDNSGILLEHGAILQPYTEHDLNPAHRALYQQNGLPFHPAYSPTPYRQNSACVAQKQTPRPTNIPLPKVPVSFEAEFVSPSEVTPPPPPHPRPHIFQPRTGTGPYPDLSPEVTERYAMPTQYIPRSPVASRIARRQRQQNSHNERSHAPTQNSANFCDQIRDTPPGYGAENGSTQTFTISKARSYDRLASNRNGNGSFKEKQRGVNDNSTRSKESQRTQEEMAPHVNRRSGRKDGVKVRPRSYCNSMSGGEGFIRSNISSDRKLVKHVNKKSKHRQSLYSIEFGPSLDTIRRRADTILDFGDDQMHERGVGLEGDNGELSPKPMTPRRVKRRSVMHRGSNSRQSTASRRSSSHKNTLRSEGGGSSGAGSTGTHSRSSTRSSRRKYHQNPVTKLMDQQQSTMNIHGHHPKQSAKQQFGSFHYQKTTPALTASNLQSLNQEMHNNGNAVSTSVADGSLTKTNNNHYQSFRKNISPDPIYYNTNAQTAYLQQQQWQQMQQTSSPITTLDEPQSPTLTITSSLGGGHYNPTYQHSTTNLNDAEHVDELYNNRPPSVRSSYSNFHGARPMSSYVASANNTENVFVNLVANNTAQNATIQSAAPSPVTNPSSYHQNQQPQMTHESLSTPPLYQQHPIHQHTLSQPSLPLPPPLPDPPYTSSQPQPIPFHKRTASRESIRSMAFLNSGPPAYNLNYHTPPDSETTM